MCQEDIELSTQGQTSREEMNTYSIAFLGRPAHTLQSLYIGQDPNGWRQIEKDW